ncbi:hypothetical protein J6590_061720 [Homalodisca vitripennis]|nr:hypothetical protein J6590_061720 [Homalodisca vitripennis]
MTGKNVPRERHLSCGSVLWPVILATRTTPPHLEVNTGDDKERRSQTTIEVTGIDPKVTFQRIATERSRRAWELSRKGDQNALYWTPEEDV